MPSSSTLNVVSSNSLSSIFRLCYAQAPFTSQPGSDVTAVYKTFGLFRAWLRWLPENPDVNNLTAVMFIENAVKDTMR